MNTTSRKDIARRHPLVQLLLIVSFCSFFALPLHAQELFSKQMDLLVDGYARTLYYESSQDIGVAGNTINRVIVLIHGAGRTNITFERVLDAATANGVADETFMFAPQFLVDDDIAANSLGPEVLFWPNGWRQGHLSTDNGRGRISSFELVNRIVRDLVVNNPGIADIVIAGHSAGGQYAQRFAAASLLEQDVATMISSVRVRYVPVNPSSMVYMDTRRRVGNTIDQFAVPDNASCPDYDEYKYGLSGGFNNFVNSIGGASQIRAQYGLREVRYLLGEEDNNPNSSSLDTSCEGNLQGRHRLERGMVYYNHIREFFAESAHDTHLIAVSPDIGHSSRIFTADCGMSFLFGIGDCSFLAPTHLEVTVNSGNGDVSLTWSDRADGEADYEVLRSDDGGDTYTLLTMLPADSTAYVDNAAMPATQYRYRVRVRNGDSRSAPSNTAIANPGASPPVVPPPPLPTPPPVSTGGGGGMGVGVLVLLILAAIGQTRASQLLAIWRQGGFHRLASRAKNDPTIVSRHHCHLVG